MTKKIQIVIAIAFISLFSFESCHSNSNKETPPAATEQTNTNSDSTLKTTELPSVETKDSISSETKAEEKKEPESEEKNEEKEK